MKVIHKFPIEMANAQLISMPLESEILSVDIQNNIICLWALCSYGACKMHERKILIFGTGSNTSDLDSFVRFIGTVQLNGFVWHIFERT